MLVAALAGAALPSGCSDYGNVVARNLAYAGAQQAVVSGVRNEMEGPRGTTVNVNNQSGSSQGTSSAQTQGPTWYDGKLTSGANYTGQFLNNRPHGDGKIIWLDGGSYIGQFFQGMLHGSGTYTWSNGNVYVGEYHEGKRQGRGRFTRADGTVFEGEYREDQEFRGTATLANGTAISGEWGTVNKGTIRYPDGRLYEGEWDWDRSLRRSATSGWIEERPNGLGVMTYPDGRKEDGLWSQGEFVWGIVKE